VTGIRKFIHQIGVNGIVRDQSGNQAHPARFALGVLSGRKIDTKYGIFDLIPYALDREI
jgi:hypothetical protein